MSCVGQRLAMSIQNNRMITLGKFDERPTNRTIANIKTATISSSGFLKSDMALL
jgi:hypothetical protein